MSRPVPGSTLKALAGSAFSALVALAALQVVVAPSAAAHDVLIKTIPADGATVGKVPASVGLVFDQPAQQVGTKIVIAGPDGPVQQGQPALVNDQVRQRVIPGSPAGHYTVTWRVTSADGHPVSGTFSFTARQAAAGTAPDPKARSTSPAPTPSSDPRVLPVPALAWGAIGLAILVAGAGWLIKRSSKP